MAFIIFAVISAYHSINFDPGLSSLDGKLRRPPEQTEEAVNIIELAANAATEILRHCCHACPPEECKRRMETQQ